MKLKINTPNLLTKIIEWKKQTTRDNGMSN